MGVPTTEVGESRKDPAVVIGPALELVALWDPNEVRVAELSTSPRPMSVPSRTNLNKIAPGAGTPAEMLDSTRILELADFGVMLTCRPGISTNVIAVPFVNTLTSDLTA
tara:strand:+ start:185 stop:511 length:327 start_codon:yes stop_codon:yes gene_type:complete